MPEMKTLNGYEVVDAKARQDIEVLKNTEVDLTSYATKSELPTKVSQLQNDSRFITLEEVPATDLSAYAKKTDIPDVSGFITSIPSEYITESELNAKGYLTQEDLPASIDTSKFLTKVDNNDQYMWYATTTNANQVIQNHVPIEKLDSKLDVVVGGKTLNNNTIAMREGLQIRVPEAPTNAGHAASKAYVDKAIAAIPEVDLSSYANKSEIPTKVSQLANDSNYLTAIPSEYVTEAELEAKGYLTEHQSLAAAYATKTYVDTTVAENQPNLSGYAKKTDIPDVSGFISEIPSEYVTDSELAAKGYLVEANLSEYAKKTEIPTVPTKTSQLTNDSNFLTAVPAEYITETELDNKGYLTEHQSLSEYAKKSEIPDVSHFITSIPEEYVTETELNNKGYLTQHQSLEGYATKTYVDDAIAGINIPEGNGSIVYLDIRNIGTSYEPAPQEAITLAKDLLAGKSLIVYLRVSDTEYRQADIKCGTSSVELFAAPKINVNNGDATQGICVIQNFNSNGAEDWQAYKAIGTRPALVTQSELDTAIAGIEIPGGTSKEVVEIPYSNTFPTAMQDKLKEIWLYGVAGNNILDKYNIYIIDAANKTSCKANSVYCYGSETGDDGYKRFKVSAQKSESFLFSCIIRPYISKIQLDTSEGLVTMGYLQSNFPTWQSYGNVDPTYCRWNWTNTDVRMVKLIGQVSGKTDHYATFEITAPNSFSFNTNTYHQVPNLLGVKSSGDNNTYDFLRVYYTGDYFELQNPDGTNCSEHITPVAMYYLT